MQKEFKTFLAQIHPALLKTVVKILGGIMTDIANLHITSKGITITAIDMANVAMIRIQLEKTVFEKFEATEFEICIDMERLKKIVNLVEADDSITMKFDSRDNQFIINLDNLETRMGLVDLNETLTAPPTILNSSGHIVLHVNDIKRSITAAENITDTVILSIDPEKFEIKAEKNMDLVHLTLSKENLIEHNSETHHKNSYSTNYLSNIISCLNGENCIRLRFGNETQLQLDYNFSESGGHLIYVLLPRLE